MDSRAANPSCPPASRWPLLMPGVFDALSARLAARAGFEVVFVSGYGMSATQLWRARFRPAHASRRS